MISYVKFYVDLYGVLKNYVSVNLVELCHKQGYFRLFFELLLELLNFLV